MQGFGQKNHQQGSLAAANSSLNPASNSANRSAKPSSFQASNNLGNALNQAFDHNHAPAIGDPSVHVSLSNVDNARAIDARKIRLEKSLQANVGNRGDLYDSGAGNDVVIASGSDDVIMGRNGGSKTITTGTGRDTVILGRETTNRIFDFNPAIDRFVLDNINPSDIVIAQGKNPGKGGIKQPLDSVNNALIIDKSTEHILASLTFVKSTDLSEKHFSTLTQSAENSLNRVNFKNFKQGSGTVTGTLQSDKIVGSGGNDFLYVGNDGFTFKTAKGLDEFPFPTPSNSTGEVNATLKDGVFRVSGAFRDFDGAPLFSQGETTIDPKATILNGSDPQALVDGFLKVPKDVEGNAITGTHLHFSPAGDDRGNFADATVIRYVQNPSNPDGKSGTLTGQFNLTPEEQAALLAGNIYMNIHSNIDVDGDGKAGFPTGELRINLNKNVVQFA